QRRLGPGETLLRRHSVPACGLWIVPRHRAPGRVQPSEPGLRTRLPVFRGQSEPHRALDVVLQYPAPLQICRAETGLSLRISLRGGPLPQKDGLAVAPVHTPPIEIGPPKLGLRLRITLVGRTPEPFHRFDVVGRDTATVRVHLPNVALASGK